MVDNNDKKLSLIIEAKLAQYAKIHQVIDKIENLVRDFDDGMEIVDLQIVYKNNNS